VNQCHQSCSAFLLCQEVLMQVLESGIGGKCLAWQEPQLFYN
jgi:hypothetical protein